jgi:hypothetical protein
MTARLRCALAVALLAALAVPAVAAVPGAPRIRAAAAERDRVAARVQGLALEVELRFEGAAAPAATGTLWTSPAGASRLELLSEAGFIERQIVRGRLQRASRDGVLQETARPVLPPLYLLQASTADVLAAWLAELGVRPDQVALGHEGPRDCYVLGGKAPGAAAVWIDMESFDVVRIDLAAGTRYRLGPFRPFEGVLLPEWMEVAAPGEPAVRLEVRSATPAAAGPEAFAPAWLEAR